MKVVAAYVFLIFAVSLIPLGIVLALYLDNPAWLLLSVLALVFFYAG